MRGKGTLCELVKKFWESLLSSPCHLKNSFKINIGRKNYLEHNACHIFRSNKKPKQISDLQMFQFIFEMDHEMMNIYVLQASSVQLERNALKLTTRPMACILEIVVLVTIGIYHNS